MARSLKWLFWTLLFGVMMIGVDQFLMQVAPVHPVHESVCRFYRDFRERLVGLVLNEPLPKPKSIEAVIERSQTKKPAASGTDEAAKSAKSKRYVYANEEGALQFADSLEEVPAQYRATAQPLAE